MCSSDRVSDNADRIKNDFVFPVVQGGKTVGQPCNGIGFAAARRVLNEIVFLAVMFYYICHQLAHGIELMITGENQRFLGDTLSGIRVFLGLLLQEYDFINQI